MRSNLGVCCAHERGVRHKEVCLRVDSEGQKNCSCIHNHIVHEHEIKSKQNDVGLCSECMMCGFIHGMEMGLESLLPATYSAL